MTFSNLSFSFNTQAISDERGFGSFRFAADDNNDQKQLSWKECYRKQHPKLLLHLFTRGSSISKKDNDNHIHW